MMMMLVVLVCFTGDILPHPANCLWNLELAKDRELWERELAGMCA
jgi:hypothetical protein